MVEGFGGVLSV